MTNAPILPPIESDRLPELLERWATSSRSGSIHTRRARLGDLRAFAAHLGLEGPPEHVQIEAAQALLLDPAGPVGAATRVGHWIAAMKSAGYATRTIARRVMHLRSLVSVANDHGLPWQLKVKGPKISSHAGVEGPPAEKVWQVLRGLERTPGATTSRSRAIIACLYLACLRRSELVGLNLADLEYSESRLKIHAKGGKLKHPRIATYVRDALGAWIRYRGRSPGPMFCAIAEIGKVPRRLSVDSVYRLTISLGLGAPHGLRHTAGTELARAGRLDLAQAILDHDSLATTGTYVDKLADAQGEASRLLAGESESDESGQ